VFVVRAGSLVPPRTANGRPPCRDPVAIARCCHPHTPPRRVRRRRTPCI